MICRHCSQAIADGAAYCTRCGAPAAPIASPPISNAIATGRQDRRTAVVVAALLVAVAAVMAAIIVAALSHSGAHQTQSTALATPLPARGRAIKAVTTTQTVEPSGSDLQTYDGPRYRLAVPITWQQDEREVQKSGYIESRWRAPGTRQTLVLVDYTVGFSGSPATAASGEHDLVSGERGYQELQWRPGTVAGLNSWIWEFALPGTQRVDYFFQHCGTGYAILEVAPPGSWQDETALFSEITNSFSPTC